MVERTKSAWWQVLVGVAAVVIAVGVVFQVVSSSINAHEAIRASKSASDSEQQLRAADAAVVAGLDAQLKVDSGQLLVVGRQNAKLLADIRALQKQIVLLGGVPVVVVPVSPAPSPSSAPSSSVRPRPGPTRTVIVPSPSPSPSPSPVPMVPPLGSLVPSFPRVPSTKGL